MKIDNSKNNGMLVGRALTMQNLCEICANSSCTECPSRRSTAEEDWHDFPQIIDGENTAGVIKVFSCKSFRKRLGTKIKTKRKEFVWNPQTKRYE